MNAPIIPCRKGQVESSASVSCLGSITLSTTDLAKLEEHYTEVLGLSVVGRGKDQVVLADRCGQEAIVLRSDSAAYCDQIALQAPSEEGLKRLVHNLRREGVSLEIRRDVTPGIAKAFAFRDVKGTEVLLFTGRAPTLAAAGEHGIGVLKLGHVAFSTPDVTAACKFYGDNLGFRVSDWIEDFFVFLRCGPDHHTLNLLRGSRTFMHHMAFELKDWSHFLTACDTLGRHKKPIIWGPGRHTVGHNLFVYYRDPDDHVIELYAELDQMKDEEMGAFEPRPWHGRQTMRPQVWSKEAGLPMWGTPPTPDFRRNGEVHLSKS